MTIVEFDPSQFEGKDGDKKFREWLKGLSRVQLLELEDTNVLSEEYWDLFYTEQGSRMWPLGEDFRKSYLSKLFRDFHVSSSKSGEKTFEAILERLEPQVQGIQKKLDKLLELIGSNEVTMSVKTALKL